MIEKCPERYTFTNYGYTAKKATNIFEDVEKQIEGLEHPCNFCNKTFRSSHSLRNHKKAWCV